MKLFSFEQWSLVNEEAQYAFPFDAAARYQDPSFGLTIGDVNKAQVNVGGEGGSWGGSMPRALAFAKIANDFMGKNVISSQKRSAELTASGNMSDHYKENENAYAIDLACSQEDGDRLLAHLMTWFGHPEYKGGSWFNTTKDGYRYQFGWRVEGHFDHIHIGVKKTLGGKVESEVNKIETSARNLITRMPGNSFAEKLVANPEFLQWYKSYAPEKTEAPTAEFINQYISDNPDQKDWFIKRFNLTQDGDKLGGEGQPADLANVPPAPDNKVASDLTTQKIKTTYTGEKARNIDLIVDEIQKAGVTNKYAIIGILSTIGKESGFIPKNEIPYSTTDNARIRKIFGSRVTGLSDEELTALKKDVPKFWDRVYGADDPSGRSQKYGNSNPGDGAKYLGRGFNGITFKANYKKFGDMIGMDLVSNPEVLNDPKVAAEAAVKFLLTVLKGMNIDPNSFTNKEDAILAFVKANHGGTLTTAVDALGNATKVSQNLDIA